MFFEELEEKFIKRDKQTQASFATSSEANTKMCLKLVRPKDAAIQMNVFHNGNYVEHYITEQKWEFERAQYDLKREN